MEWHHQEKVESNKGWVATTEFAESRIDMKIRLALDPKWKNALYIEEKILVPKGTKLHVVLLD